jgi:tight adherence protein C
MSEQAYLLVAVLATFVTVLLVVTRLVLSAPNRRAATVLQGHLESLGVEVATDRGGAASFVDRVVTPAVGAATSWISRVTPTGMRDGVARKLTLAGNRRGTSAEFFLLLQALSTIGGLAAGYYIGVLNGPNLLGVLWIPSLGFAGYLFPSTRLDGRARARQGAIRRDLADMIDLLTISVEAGLAFDAALLHARRAMSGPLAEEVGRLLHEIQLGARRVDAMRNLSERTSVDELRSFVLAMVQADVFGVSVANVLRSQSQELRTKRRQYAEERAMKVPVKLLFPMICCILPALLVLIVGPGAIRIANIFGETGGAGVFGP